MQKVETQNACQSQYLKTNMELLDPCFVTASLSLLFQYASLSAWRLRAKPCWGRDF